MSLPNLLLLFLVCCCCNNPSWSRLPTWCLATRPSLSVILQLTFTAKQSQPTWAIHHLPGRRSTPHRLPILTNSQPRPPYPPPHLMRHILGQLLVLSKQSKYGVWVCLGVLSLHGLCYMGECLYIYRVLYMYIQVSENIMYSNHYIPIICSMAQHHHWVFLQPAEHLTFFKAASCNALLCIAMHCCAVEQF